MKIYQILNTLVSGDAIGNNTFSLYNILKKYDPDTKILAVNIGDKIEDKYSFVGKLNDLSFIQPDDVVIYHLCECCEINIWLKKINCKKIAIYHNTTPSYFFEDIDTSTYFRQINSEIEIKEMKSLFDYCIAVSEFNRLDLIKMGYDAARIIVTPLLVPTYEYTNNIELIKPYYEDDYINILFVGRIVPNKKQDDVIRTFAYYKKFINPKSRLILIGSPFTETYLEALKMYVDELELKDVVFKSGLSFNDIKRVYKCADVFLCLSEHEGFCVPLVEAMLFEVPVVAFKCTAVADTLGPGGCLVENKNVHLLANYINSIVTDDNIKKIVLDYQNKRVKSFDYELVCEKWDLLLNQLLFNS